MRKETTLILGDFEFSGLEIPAQIVVGGAQRLSVHELVGGVRVIDAMGRSERPLEWSGILLGSGRNAAGAQVYASAGDRARFLDSLRVGGQVQTLSWGEYRYAVIVSDFTAEYRRSFEIPYRITCTVVGDATAPIDTAGVTPIDAAVQADMTSAQNLAGAIGDSKLSALMATLQTAISTVSTFARAAQSTINSVLAPLAAVQQQVGVLITSSANAALNISTFGGVLSSNLISQNVTALAGQATNSLNTAALYQLRGVTGRMAQNLNAASSTQNSVATAGGNLFQIAQKQYGDPMAWTGIARANGLTDPFVQGAQVLKVPVQPDTTGGVLGA